MINKCKVLNGGKKKTQFGGSKGKKGKKGLSKGNDGFHKGGFSPLPARQRCRQGFSPKTKAEEKNKEEKAKKEPILNPDSQPQKHCKTKDMARPGISDDWSRQSLD